MAIAGGAGALIVWLGLLGFDPVLGTGPLLPPPQMTIESRFEQRILGLDAWESALAVRLRAPTSWCWAVGVGSIDAGHLQELSGRAWLWRTGRSAVLGLCPVVRRAAVAEFALVDARVEAVARRDIAWGSDRFTLGVGVDVPLREPGRVPPSQHTVDVGWAAQGWAASLLRSSARYGGPARWRARVRVGSDRAHIFTRWSTRGTELGVGWEADQLAASASIPITGLLPTGPALLLGWSP